MNKTGETNTDEINNQRVQSCMEKLLAVILKWKELLSAKNDLTILFVMLCNQMMSSQTPNLYLLCSFP